MKIFTSIQQVINSKIMIEKFYSIMNDIAEPFCQLVGEKNHWLHVISIYVNEAVNNGDFEVSVLSTDLDIEKLKSGNVDYLLFHQMD